MRKKTPKIKRLKKQGRRIERVQRRCLNCDSSFSAKGKFNRICIKCKKREAHMFAEDDVTINTDGRPMCGKHDT